MKFIKFMAVCLLGLACGDDPQDPDMPIDWVNEGPVSFETPAGPDGAGGGTNYREDDGELTGPSMQIDPAQPGDEVIAAAEAEQRGADMGALGRLGQAFRSGMWYGHAMINSTAGNSIPAVNQNFTGLTSQHPEGFCGFPAAAAEPCVFPKDRVEQPTWTYRFARETCGEIAPGMQDLFSTAIDRAFNKPFGNTGVGPQFQKVTANENITVLCSTATDRQTILGNIKHYAFWTPWGNFALRGGVSSPQEQSNCNGGSNFLLAKGKSYAYSAGGIWLNAAFMAKEISFSASPAPICQELRVASSTAGRECSGSVCCDGQSPDGSNGCNTRRIRFVQNTILHELGHIFGLNHFTIDGQPMQGAASCDGALTVDTFNAAEKESINDFRTDTSSGFNWLTNSQLHCQGPDTNVFHVAL